jgi:hypothetical protein
LRYQRIVGGDNRVTNAVPFGRRLRRFLKEPEQLQLAGERCWRAGGAWMLADALSHWSRGALRMVALVRPDRQFAHVVTEATSLGTYVDADGVAGRLELMAKLALLMREPQVEVAEFSALEARKAGFEYDPEIAMELALRLLRRFRTFRPELLVLPDSTLRRT